MSDTPTQPEFWEKRYRANRTPWDARGVPAALDRYLEAHPGRGATVLIPGCGSGHEIKAFAQAGYKVTAIDFSPAAVERARANLPSTLTETVVEGDFFTRDLDAAPFDLIYERTFLCALPPELWPRVASRSAALLKPQGNLVGLYFLGPRDDGPPFGSAPDELEALFGGGFVMTADLPVPPDESLPLFQGAERWQERRRIGG